MEEIPREQLIRSIMKALYNMSDEDNYNVYPSEDIADYLGLSKEIVDDIISTLWNAGLLLECMTEEDDGVATFVLNDKAIDLVEMG